MDMSESAGGVEGERRGGRVGEKRTEVVREGRVGKGREEKEEQAAHRTAKQAQEKELVLALRKPRRSFHARHGFFRGLFFSRPARAPRFTTRRRGARG